MIEHFGGTFFKSVERLVIKKTKANLTQICLTFAVPVERIQHDLGAAIDRISENSCADGREGKAGHAFIIGQSKARLLPFVVRPRE